MSDWPVRARVVVSAEDYDALERQNAALVEALRLAKSLENLGFNVCHADMVHGAGKQDVTGTTSKEYQAEADKIQARIDAAIAAAKGEA